MNSSALLILSIEDIEPQVSIADGLRALELAESILDKMKLSHQLA